MVNTAGEQITGGFVHYSHHTFDGFIAAVDA